MVAMDYFTQLFTSTSGNTNFDHVFAGGELCCLTEADRIGLIKHFSPTEVQAVFKGMHPSKSPRPDGKHVSFYQTYSH